MKTLRINLEKIEPMLSTIVWSLDKAVGQDIREYYDIVDTVTHNALPQYRNVRINTNIKRFVESAGVEAKVFNRAAWEGVIVIDRQSKITLTVCSKITLDRIPRKKNRKWPHYLQTILHILNADLEAPVKQMSMQELYGDEFTKFTPEEYKEDFDSIMNDEINYDDGYRHGVVVYTREGLHISSVQLKFLDPDFDTVKEYSLIEMLRPDFSDLTENEYENQNDHAKTSLVSLKEKTKKSRIKETDRKKTLAQLKTEEEGSMQA